MPRFPYINFPFPSYRGYYNGPVNYYSRPLPTNNNSNMNNENDNKKNKSNKNTDGCLFDLFGLKIYDDDVLLVSLIYFLYSEGVKDDGLFIVLILLLLS